MSNPTDSPSASNTPPEPSSLPTTTDANALGMRIVYMIIFGVAFWILCWTLAITAVLQLIVRLLGGKPSPDLARFGASLGRFAQQVIEYLTFRSDRLPYPFTEWPQQPV
jgi:hypothetical protein